MAFLTTIAELAYGEAVAEYDTAINEMALAVKEHQKPGTMTIVLKFLPKGGDQIEVVDSYKVSKPEHGRQSTITYVQRDGSLSRRDPRQPVLPLSTVPASTQNAEQVATNG